VATIDRLERERHELAASSDLLLTLQQQLREPGDVQARIDVDSKHIATLRDRVITAMQDYVTAWPLDAREVDVSIEATPEFRRMLQVLEADDLPRFAGKFKKLLNENSIRKIAG
jgi:uncharacterized protein YPO0396